MNLKRMMMAAAAAAVAWTGFAETVANVRGMQRENSHLVDIYYDLEAPEGGTYFVAVQIEGRTKEVNATTFTGDVGDCIVPGKNKRVVWDAGADWPRKKGDVRAIVTATKDDGKPKRVQLWEGGPYWADRNIGADSPCECGLYFWWGDTIGYKREGNAWVATDELSSNFQFYSDPISKQTYNKSISTLQSEGWIITKSETNVLAPEHDAAQVLWGGGWRMPTDEELGALNSKCDWIWTTKNGMHGCIVRGRDAYASNSIFLPCAGLGSGTSLRGFGSYGYFWSSVPRSYGSDCSWNLALYYSELHDMYTDDCDRNLGQSVRPVQGFTNSSISAVVIESSATGSSAWFPVDTTDGTLTLKPNSAKRGEVSGGGKYAAGKAVKIKATAKKGYAFAGWFTDKACTKALKPAGYDNRNPTVKIVMPAKNTTVYAKFVTKADAKKSLKFLSATAKLAKTPAKATAGGKFSLKLGISSASLPSVTAKGLPKGLSINKTTGEIAGTPTKPGSYIVTVTVKDAAGNKITQEVKILVSVPSWTKGTFYGLAFPGVTAKDSWSYLQFAVDSAGGVSGKVKYNGKWCSFKSSCSSCTAAKMTFSPKVKIGSSVFKPGAVTAKRQNAGGVSVVAASDKYGFVAAQKKPGLVKKGKALAKLVGKSYTFSSADANSGLTKSKDKLVVALGDGDSVTVSGVVGGKKLSPLTWALLVSAPGAGSGDAEPAYTLYVDIIDATLKYERTLVITATVSAGGVKATAAFAK